MGLEEFGKEISSLRIADYELHVRNIAREVRARYHRFDCQIHRARQVAPEGYRRAMQYFSQLQTARLRNALAFGAILGTAAALPLGYLTHGNAQQNSYEHRPITIGLRN